MKVHIENCQVKFEYGTILSVETFQIDFVIDIKPAWEE